MTRFADGRYDHNAPGAGEPYLRPGYNSNEERLVSEALAAALDPGPGMSDALRNGGAKGDPFPPRFTGQERTEPTIHDIIQVDRRYPDSSAQFSGSAGSYSGSSTPSLGWW